MSPKHQPRKLVTLMVAFACLLALLAGAMEEFHERAEAGLARSTSVEASSPSVRRGVDSEAAFVRHAGAPASSASFSADVLEATDSEDVFEKSLHFAPSLVSPDAGFAEILSLQPPLPEAGGGVLTGLLLSLRSTLLLI